MSAGFKCPTCKMPTVGRVVKDKRLCQYCAAVLDDTAETLNLHTKADQEAYEKAALDALWEAGPSQEQEDALDASDALLVLSGIAVLCKQHKRLPDKGESRLMFCLWRTVKDPDVKALIQSGMRMLLSVDRGFANQ